MTFQDIFPGLSRTLSFKFQDFPGPGMFKKKNPGLSKRRGNPATNVDYTGWLQSQEQSELSSLLKLS